MISIALASYNGEKYIREQLDSILNQTIQDFEVVVCDDASTDGTWSILEEYKKKDSRFRIYKNEENLGFKKNFEKAISLCKGSYIALSDQDDIWVYKHLEILLDNIGEYNIICGNSEIVNKNGVKIGKTLRSNMLFEVIDFSDHLKPYRLLYFSSPYQGSAMLIRKEFFLKALPIPSGAISHDAWFASLATFYGGIKYINKTVLYYRRHENNISGISKEKSFFLRIKNTKSERTIFQDRVCFINAIFSRVKTLNKSQKNILNKALEYHTKKKSRLYRFTQIPFRIKHYKLIYTTNSYKLLIPRLVKYLL